jgi:hypothetical protein
VATDQASVTSVTPSPFHFHSKVDCSNSIAFLLAVHFLRLSRHLEDSSTLPVTLCLEFGCCQTWEIEFTIFQATRENIYSPQFPGSAILCFAVPESPELRSPSPTLQFSAALARLGSVTFS